MRIDKPRLRTNLIFLSLVKYGLRYISYFNFSVLGDKNRKKAMQLEKRAKASREIGSVAHQSGRYNAFRRASPSAEAQFNVNVVMWR